MIIRAAAVRHTLVAMTATGTLAVLAGCSSSLGAVTVGPPPQQSAAPASNRSTAPTPAIPAAPLTHPPRTVTMTGSGDILIHPSLWQQAQSDGAPGIPNFVPMLAGVKERVSAADYSICHDETQFNDAAGPITTFPHYYVHPNLAKGIAATGFNECSIASNWTFDKGLDGIRRTNAALSKAGVNHAGSAGSPAQAGRFVVRDVNSVKFAHMSYTDPDDSPGIRGSEWAINRQAPAQIAADAKAARAAGAQIVVVSLAMGTMGDANTGAAQRKAVQTITAGGDVDFIIGHGSHTIQPAQLVNNTWVVWHGNLMSAFFDDQLRMHEGLLSWVKFTEQPGGRFKATTVRGYPVLDVSSPGRVIDLAAQSCTSMPARWQTAYEATRSTEATAIKAGFELMKPCSGK